MSDNEILRAKKKAMALLQHNDRTEWELIDKLERAGFSEEAVADALEYVKSFHYIDDERYARRYAEIYCDRRSIRRIQQDLYKKHVPEKFVSRALEAIDYDDSEALKKECTKILRNCDELTYEEKQKAAARLYRKGFSRSDIMKVLDM